MSAEKLDQAIAAQGLKIRELKASKAGKEALDKEVATLLELKKQYKEESGKDWKPAVDNSKPPVAPPKKEKGKADVEKSKGEGGGGEKASKKQKKGEEVKDAAPPAVFKAPKGMVFYPSVVDGDENMKVWLLASEMKGKVNMTTAEKGSIPPDVPRLPALSDKNGTQIRFGGNSICKYIDEVSGTTGEKGVDELFAIEESSSEGKMQKIEALLAKNKDPSPLLMCVLYPLIKKSLASSGSNASACASVVSTVESYAGFKSVHEKTQANLDSLDDFDYRSAGLQTSLRLVFSHAIVNAFPETVGLQMYDAQIVRCGNPNFGDFQCNNAMSIAKALKVNCGESSFVLISRLSLPFLLVLHLHRISSWGLVARGK